MALLISHWLVGIFWEHAHCQVVERAGIWIVLRRIVLLQGMSSFSALPIAARKTLTRSVRASQYETSRIWVLCACQKNERTSAAVPHQGIRILSRSVRFSLPRGNKVNKNRRRVIEYSRRSIHGIACAIESLRRVRMSLVPRPNSRECLLLEV